MACIKKLASSIQFDCESGSMGFVSALILNISDLASYVEEASKITALTATSTWFKVDTIKKSVVVNDSLRVNDGAPNGIVNEALITVYDKGNAELINQLKNSRVVLMTRTSRGVIRIYGLYHGLQASAVSASSDSNGGWLTFTMSTPEGVIGENYITVTEAVYNAAYNAAT